MAETVTFTIDEAKDLALQALTNCGTAEDNAEALIGGILGAELDGISSHGFMYLPIYCEHVKCGKIDGNASPTVPLALVGLVKIGNPSAERSLTSSRKAWPPRPPKTRSLFFCAAASMR